MMKDLSLFEARLIDHKLDATPAAPTVTKEVAQPYYNTEDERVKIFHLDALDFLASIPSGSVDIITTDPAYSGMNQHLQLGQGRIIGKYTDKATSGKWFEEFHDTPENYGNFLRGCLHLH